MKARDLTHISALDALEAIKQHQARENLWAAEARTLLGMIGKDGIPQDKLAQMAREFLDRT